MKTKLGLCLFILLLLPATFVLAMYITAHRTGLPGRRGGPQDAFRHTYTSALVARYSSAEVVGLVTYLTEADAESPQDQMDIHNNTLGAKLGASYSGSLYDLIFERVRAAEVNAVSSDVIRVLPESSWDNGF